ncbi:hypothetical protein WJX81_008438 [Elliptochloris bilobata]|uniref:Gelsolin-like domain-containing protein n=1 Tax=Elliptochloris bilobata TaxID=381761 RepID=A0AAW1RGM6_9CHLO
MSACLEDFLHSQAGRPGLHAWRVEGLKAVEVGVPGDLDELSAGECFIFLHTLDLGTSRDHSIYIWRGRHASEDKANAAAVLATDLHDFLGGSHAQIREAQGRESTAFQQLFDPEASPVANGHASAASLDSQAAGQAERLYQVMPDGLQEVHRRPLGGGVLDSRGCYAVVADGTVHLWRGAAAEAAGGVADVYAQLEALLGRLNLPPDAPICLAREGGEGPKTMQLLDTGEEAKATPSRKGRVLPLSASLLALGPRTPSPAALQRPASAEGSEETLSPRPAAEVDAEAAADWEAHVTAKLRAQVLAALQAEAAAEEAGARAAAAECMRTELRESVRAELRQQLRAEAVEAVRAELAPQLRAELAPKVAEEVRRELRQQLHGGAPSASLADAQEAKAAAAAAAERAHEKGLLPKAVRDLDLALREASPTKIAAVGDELPQALSELAEALQKLHRAGPQPDGKPEGTSAGRAANTASSGL